MLKTLGFLAVLASAKADYNILSFGDSQGDTGPTYAVIQDVLDQNNVAAKVVNAAVGGTLSCGWAAESDAIVTAGRSAFPVSGPDLVWLTVGGNDLAGDAKYHACLKLSKTDSAARRCLDAANSRLMECTKTLLDGLWKGFPDAKVGMYNYEVPCVEDYCLEESANFLGGDYCLSQSSPIGCMVDLLSYWQTIYVDALEVMYGKEKFTGMNMLGVAQQASGVPGASQGNPSRDAGSKCEWMTSCVHPTYGTKTADAIGEVLWMDWLRNVTNV
ncbi:hypothetical protein TrST_g12548 [Triparma strigata]|uniref:SGNH hydrolase-type esterase domain-containing protein n=1 Tax=Triparma strigata TaxID=1606541 RepID=A0A9W7B6F0_9STRA|nr:hypothetical protein TrST_g12548 [Triparma strigata]